MSGVERFLEGAFGAAQPDHYFWQTSQPFVRERERELVQSAFLPLGRRVLDIGCSEGATLFHLGEPEGAVGVDLFEAKVEFARARLPRCRFVVGSAYELPFDDGSFDHVLVRDVIHHLDRPERALLEIRRVLAPGGRVDVLEPCRYNPLILLHALARKEERGELRSSMSFLTSLLDAAGFRVLARTRHQPMPVHRVVFHPELGRPSLGANALGRLFVGGFERVARHLIPKPFWAYLHVRATLHA
jgi:SAM-dependent methyltransferase